MRWYYVKRGRSEVRGCVDEKQIHQLLRKGVLASPDLLWPESGGEAWRPVSAVVQFASPRTGRLFTWILLGLFVATLLLFGGIRYWREIGETVARLMR